MRLLELHIDGFGKFHDRTISFNDGINIIYGKNEAGKSTLHTFIRGMLFGIERGRGRAAKNDLYTKYEPWENSGTYEGWLRLEKDGTIYRIERRFRKENKSLKIINETKGLEEEATPAFVSSLLDGLTETMYNNTISIGQLKSATEDGMVTELKNYIANMNTTGNISLNITKATAFLRNQKRSLESDPRGEPGVYLSSRGDPECGGGDRRSGVREPARRLPEYADPGQGPDRQHPDTEKGSGRETGKWEKGAV
jgi:uncharacterized protein YhaN